MSIEINDEQLEAILQGINIPPQPQILVDIQMEQFQPDPDVGRIANLIAKDVGLAGTMLKIVNSPLYGLRSTITSVPHAVNLLGLKTVINIINGLSIKGELNDESIVKLNRFWDTAMDIAIVAQGIARQVGFPAADEAYALGLFHNVGIPLMSSRFPDYFETMVTAYQGEGERLIDLENQRYRTNHAVVGYYCAKSWRLPRHMCEVIADHHSLDPYFRDAVYPNVEKKNLLCILKVAEHFCGNFDVLGEARSDREWEVYSVPVLEHLGLSQFDLENMYQSFVDAGMNVVF